MGGYITVSLPVLFLAVALQSSFVPQIRFFGGQPDLVLLLVLSWAANRDLDEGLAWAFVGGILQDLRSSAPTGAATLGMIPVIFLIYLLNRQFYRVGPFLALFLFFVGTFIKELIVAVVMAAAGLENPLLNLLSYVILPSAVYNVALGFFVFVVVRWIQRRTGPEARVTRTREN